MTELSAAVSAHLEQVVDGLVASTGGSIQRHDLRTLVNRCYHELASTAKVTTFLPVLTKRLAMTRLCERGELQELARHGLPKILVVDEHDATRGQSAAALLRFYAPGRFQVSSAGINPSGSVSHVIPELLGEVGMDLTDSPAPLDDAALQQARYVIAIGDTGIDAATVGGAYLTWDIGGEIDDTDEQGVAGVLTDIDRRVRHFLLAVDPDHELHDALLAGDGASAP
ncbi:MAG: hypothetical protein ACJAY5_000281 [Actinomycetes bacterium]|jgi:arsenate reductase